MKNSAEFVIIRVVLFSKNICVCVERRHEYKQKNNYG